MTGQPLTLGIPEELVDAIAEKAAQLVLERMSSVPATGSPYLNVDEAAAYLASSKQRVYDLLSAGRLTRFKDGSRVLVARDEIDAYLTGTRSRRVAQTLPPTRGRRMTAGSAR